MDKHWPVSSVRLPHEATALLDAVKTRMPEPSRALVIISLLLSLEPHDQTEAALLEALRDRIARSGTGLTPVANPAPVPRRLR